VRGNGKASPHAGPDVGKAATEREATGDRAENHAAGSWAPPGPSSAASRAATPTALDGRERQAARAGLDGSLTAGQTAAEPPVRASSIAASGPVTSLRIGSGSESTLPWITGLTGSLFLDILEQLQQFS